MNIFYLHEDPVQNAKWHIDKHIVKMPIEYAQLLSTAHRMLDGWEYYGKTMGILRERRRNAVLWEYHTNTMGIENTMEWHGNTRGILWETCENTTELRWIYYD